LKKSKSVLGLLKVLWRYISPKKQQQYVFLLILSFFTSLSEMFSIGAALPFISALIEPDKVYNNSLLQPLFHMLELNSPEEIILPLTTLFVSAIILSTAMRFILLRTSIKFSFNVGIDLSINIYNKILHQPYLYHTMKNSSDIINVVNTKVSEVIFYIITPSITFVNASMMAGVISIALLYFIPTPVMGVMVIFIILYMLIMKMVRKRLKVNSQYIAIESTEIIKTLQEGLGGIRDIIIDGTQDNFSNKYLKSVKILRKAQADNQIFGSTPRFFLEGMGMLFIAFFAYTLSTNPNENISMVPILVGIVLSMQKLLPLLQQMFQSWSTIQGAQASLSDSLNFLELTIPQNKISTNEKKIVPIDFKKEIRLEKVSFQYIKNGALVLNEINLLIPKGSRIGFIGSTGSGKSTLLDLVMGLLEPTKGHLIIDNKILSTSDISSWQKHIAHVPQSIYLVDGSIEDNIAFGVLKEKIDKVLVREAAVKSQIAGVIEKMPLGYDTIVGERGIQLSGGQRQRLGLARALYKKAQVIILDEATSALDGDTEREVINAFESLGNDVTLLMIAHRITTLKGCTKTIELQNGMIHRTVKYDGI
jgi:ATP-binding cassette, subfamily B, bacterial PglK